MKDNKNQEKKPRRERRSVESLENDIMEATRTLVEEMGFSNITLTGVMQRAGVEPQVFYNRYANLEALFEQFTHRYDYWLGDLVDYRFEVKDPYESLGQLLQGLVPALYKSRSMQQLLIWELLEDNPTTRRTAQQREELVRPLLEKAYELLKGKDVDVAAISAILTGGVYYLILHSGRSTFSGIDFRSDEGKERLLTVINYLVSAVAKYGQQRDEARAIALRMKERGIDSQTIHECTGVLIEN